MTKLKIKFDFTELMKRRTDLEKNNLIVVTGETGAGKSMAALDLALRLDPLFTVDQCVFTISDFLAQIQKLGKGRVVVLDEAAIGFDARRSGSNENVMFSNVLKIFRYLQITAIFTFPNLAMFDKNGRRLMHFHIVMAGINHQTKMAAAHLFIVDSHAGWDDEPKRYFPIINVENLGFTFQVDPVWFNYPPEKLRKEYDVKKNEFAQKMFDEIKDTLDKYSKTDPEEEFEDPVYAAAQEPRARRTLPTPTFKQRRST